MALAHLTINLDAFTGDDRPPLSSYSTITLDPGADHIDAAADVIHVRTIVVSLDQQGKAATANGVPCVDGKVPVVAGVAYAVSAPNVLRGGPHYIPALTAGQVVDLSDSITPGAPLTPDQAATLTARIVALEETPPGSGVTDHGALTGLGDDDHTQYALADGTRGAFAAPLGADDNYVTDAEKAALHAHSNKTALDAVSGTNTGDQTLPTWSTISGKPAVVGAGATQADARAAIGAGTSSFSGAYADLSSKPTLGDAAAKNTGTTAGTLAAGDDSRFASSGIPASIVDAKGDLIVATAADTVTRLPVGATTGHVLRVNPATATGLEWAAGVGGIGVGAFTFGYAGGDDQTLLAGNYLRSGTGTITIPTTVGHLFPMPMAHSVTVDGFRLKLATAGDGSCQLQVALYAITAAGVLGARLSPVWTVGATTTGEKYTTALTPFSVPAGMSVIVVTSSGQVSTNPQLASSGNPSPLAWSWANGEGAAGRWAACSSVTSLPDPWTAGAATSIGTAETPILGLFF